MRTIVVHVENMRRFGKMCWIITLKVALKNKPFSKIEND
jgi:hypothetical protein